MQFLYTRNHLVGYPNIPFGFTNWMPFTRCRKTGNAAKSIKFGHVPECTQHSGPTLFGHRTGQHSPVEEPPNQPQKPPVEEPGDLPQRPPLPNEPPVEEPPDKPGKPPVKAPPPKDPNRQPHKTHENTGLTPFYLSVLGNILLTVRFTQ